MGKPKAFLVHLLVSAAIVGALLLLLVTRWYPMPYFVADGGWQGIRLVAAIDVVLGPLLTLVIYDRAKPRRKLFFDYSVIGALQACAFAFGMWTVFSARTTVVVFTDGTFYTIGADEARFMHDPYPALLREAPRRPAYAMVNMPADPEARQALRRESMTDGRPLFSFLNLVGPFTPGRVPQLAEYGIDIRHLLADHPQQTKEVDRFLADHGGTVDDYLFFPVKPRYRPVVLAFHRASGELVDWLDLTPPTTVVVKHHTTAAADTASDP
jgi:hypothetical protein